MSASESFDVWQSAVCTALRLAGAQDTLTTIELTEVKRRFDAGEATLMAAMWVLRERGLSTPQTRGAMFGINPNQFGANGDSENC